MTTPARPSAVPHHARGVLAETADERIVFAVPNTDYLLHLVTLRRPAIETGKRIVGTIRARARRVDIVDTGGRYIEPVYGRPRRVQGRVIATDAADGTITVDAGVPIVCTLNAGQRAAEFNEGDLVSFDVEPGAAFTPA